MKKKFSIPDDVLFFLGVVLFTFLNAWDFLDRVIEGRDPYFLDFNEEYITMLRPIIYLLQYVIGIGYWGFFVFHILFIASFIYVGRKLNVETIHIYLPLIILPVVRYGVWDYCTGASDSLVYLIMVWTYYTYRTKNMKAYYILSIIGALTREFCLYVNLFFMIEFLFDNESIKSLFQKRKEWLNMIKELFWKFWIEMVIFVGYLIMRTLIATFVAHTDQFIWGTLFVTHLSHFTNPKMLIRIAMIYSYLTYYIIKHNKLSSYVLFIAVFIVSFIFGDIWEINKLGCLFIIYVFDLFGNNKLDTGLDLDESHTSLNERKKDSIEPNTGSNESNISE